MDIFSEACNDTCELQLGEFVVLCMAAETVSNTQSRFRRRLALYSSRPLYLADPLDLAESTYVHCLAEARNVQVSNITQ